MTSTRVRTPATPAGRAKPVVEDGGNGEDVTLLVDSLAGERRKVVRTLAVVIPAYNEGLVIGSVVLQARQHADHVIVVDDGSLDRTAAIARLAGADVIEMPARPLGNPLINVPLSHWDDRPHAIFEQPLYLECDKVW